MTDIHDFADDRRAKRNVAVLVAAQAILGSQLPMQFVVGGLAGGMIAWTPCLATLPISMIVFGSMTTAPWLSPLMQRRGRRFGFVLGTAAGGLGAAVSGRARAAPAARLRPELCGLSSSGAPACRDS